jgi:uncharacterized iron-regulated membrane protein
MVQIALPKPQDATVAVDVDFLGKRLRLFIHTVHTDEAGGFAGQTMSGLASLACCVLVWTGLSLAIRRLRA